MNQRVTPNATAMLAIAFVLFWNSGFIAAEYVLPHTGPYSLMFWRYWPLTLLLLAWLVLRGRPVWPGWGPALTESLTGILAHGVWLTCVILALQRGVPAGIVALVVALQPLATGTLSGLVAGEPTPPMRWLGLVTAFAGVLVAVSGRVDLQDSASVLAFALPFASVAAITIASLLQRRMNLRYGPNRRPLALALFYQSLATALAVTLPAWRLEGFSANPDPAFVGTMAWLIIGVSLAAYELMWKLIERMDATRVASLFYLGPPVTMIMAWLAFGDTLTAAEVWGLLIVATGFAITQRS